MLPKNSSLLAKIQQYLQTPQSHESLQPYRYTSPRQNHSYSSKNAYDQPSLSIKNPHSQSSVSSTKILFLCIDTNSELHYKIKQGKQTKIVDKEYLILNQSLLSLVQYYQTFLRFPSRKTQTSQARSLSIIQMPKPLLLPQANLQKQSMHQLQEKIQDNFEKIISVSQKDILKYSKQPPQYYNNLTPCLFYEDNFLSAQIHKKDRMSFEQIAVYLNHETPQFWEQRSQLLQRKGFKFYSKDDINLLQLLFKKYKYSNRKYEYVENNFNRSKMLSSTNRNWMQLREYSFRLQQQKQYRWDMCMDLRLIGLLRRYGLDWKQLRRVIKKKQSYLLKKTYQLLSIGEKKQKADQLINQS